MEFVLDFFQFESASGFVALFFRLFEIMVLEFEFECHKDREELKSLHELMYLAFENNLLYHKFPQFFFCLFVLRAETLYKFPESFAMVFYFQMTAFVDDDVFDESRRQMHEVEIERDMLVGGAAPSFGFSLPET